MFVMPKDYRGLSFVLPFISDELKSKSYSGPVILDLLLSNGNNSRRYFQLFFDGQGIDKASVKTLYPVPSEYLALSNNYLKTHPEVLTRGVLTNWDIDEIKRTL